MSLKISKIAVHYPDQREVHPDDAASHIEYKVGTMSGPSLKNEEIERDGVRLALRHDEKEQEANICITIQPGEQLGQLRICTQYEGKKGEHESCLNGQNDLAMKVSEWLDDLLGDAEAEWNIVIDAQPCPKAEGRYRIVEASRRMEGQHEHQRSQSRENEALVQTTREKDRTVDR